jgi:pyruvate,water dikinase
MPEPVVRAVAGAFASLAAPRLAVRSSSTIEDGPAGSLAGQFDSYLGVRGLPELLNRIHWAWASLWNARAIRALAAHGLSPLEASQAVLVQEMVETRSAGVLVARDAARGADTLLVNAAWGLGEGISLGAVPGDLFWVRRSTGEILATEPGSGAKQIVLDPSGTGTIETLLPPDRSGRLCLSGAELARLAALGRALLGWTRMIRDVEFGFDEDDALVVFQIRPVAADGTGRGPAV